MFWEELQEMFQERAEKWKVWFPESSEIVLMIPSYVALIVSFIVVFILARKKIIGHSWAKKVQKAKDLGQIVEGKLDGGKRVINTQRDGVEFARYVYSINGGKKRTKIVRCNTCSYVHEWPDTINIYYLGNKVYTDYDKRPLYDALIFLLPFVIAGIVLYFTNPGIFNTP